MRALDPDGAANAMRRAGWEPKVPYPGASTPWLSRCLKCGKESFPRLSKVKSAGRERRGCKHCARNAPVEPEVAWRVLAAAQLRPKVPYPGRNDQPWLCVCLVCGSEVSPSYSNVQQRKGRSCATCKSATLRSLRLSETSPEQAVSEMHDAGFAPLEPFPGTDSRWRSRCMRCGKHSFPRLTHVSARGSGCRHCAPNCPVDPVLAEATMLGARLRPLTPFPGSNTPWPCLCLDCGTRIAPTHYSIRAGGGCRACAVSGFKPNKPAVVYLVVHEGFNAVKIGIGNVHADRIDRHRRYGWSVIATVNVSGLMALAIEKHILDWWRNDLHLPQYLSEMEMPQRGWTETVDADAIDIPATVQRMRALAATIDAEAA